jgi:hypothetical protein
MPTLLSVIWSFGVRVFRIGQGDAAGVLVVVGPADGRIDGGAGDEIFADVVADV